MTKALDRLLVRDGGHFDPEKHMERETEIIPTKGDNDLEASNRQVNMKNHEDGKEENKNNNQVTTTTNNKEVITTRLFHTSQLGNLDLILWIMILLILFLLIILIYLLCLLCRDKR